MPQCQHPATQQAQHSGALEKEALSCVQLPELAWGQPKHMREEVLEQQPLELLDGDSERKSAGWTRLLEIRGTSEPWR